MSSKALGSNGVRELIATEWMTDEVVDHVRGQYSLSRDGLHLCDEDDYGQFGLESPDQVEHFFSREMKTPEHWEMVEESWINDLYGYDDWDVAGHVNEKLFAEFAHRELKAHDRCCLRVFEPRKDRIRDNFRLEVVTSPCDEEVITWSLIVD